MELITDAIRDLLLANAKASDEALSAGRDEPDHEPVVKLFTPDAGATWLITEMSDDGDTLYGLCDLGLGSPEIGYVSLAELSSVRGKLGLPVERDLHWKAETGLSEYARKASALGRIMA